MRITVHPNLMTTVHNHLALNGESLDRMTWDKPSCLDSQAFKQLQQTRSANLPGEHTP